MTRPLNFRSEPKYLRELHHGAYHTAGLVHSTEQDLIRLLIEMDRSRYYVRFGYNSLTSYCIHYLGFTRVQTQRIVTRVRRSEPTLYSGQVPTPHAPVARLEPAT